MVFARWLQHARRGHGGGPAAPLHVHQALGMIGGWPGAVAMIGAAGVMGLVELAWVVPPAAALAGGVLGRLVSG